MEFLNLENKLINFDLRRISQLKLIRFFFSLFLLLGL